MSQISANVKGTLSRCSTGMRELSLSSFIGINRTVTLSRYANKSDGLTVHNFAHAAPANDKTNDRCA